MTPWFHVTTLSNFARGFDKYGRRYRKANIPESTYPGAFYVLKEDELGIGVEKASKLLARLQLPGDELIAMEARLDGGAVKKNERNGKGWVWPSPDLPVHRVHRLGRDGARVESSIEELTARSLALHGERFLPYEALKPRSLSFLPIARGCEAKCPFCFSEASVSSEQSRGVLDGETVGAWVEKARTRGAERAVITGGGEPGLLPQAALESLVERCATGFRKVVLITNGVVLAREGLERIRRLHERGLSVLAVSRHHAGEARNAALMGLATQTPKLLAHRRELPSLRFRLICVLQKNGVASAGDVRDYLDFARSHGVDEVCFKELYVSTSAESVYHSREANQFSAAHQVPLSVVHEWAEQSGARPLHALPWGAPVFEHDGLRVAAYTEPSLFWERTHGLARSWNVMADGRCLASLEDKRSEVAR
jgi:hypothetical protein